ncbi:nucleotidyltransferase family protein [Aliikangiella coralliicola]|uniref:Nucleotidyltransferase family protein n=1 Tax=Aliikangiella coralliicola TaxID=2592383 RepID=A0A545U6F5_9GAMM|nr:nucleotidyltransferase family protein [Aliikangiella coralliicola]TQV85046.1 nucleotidyltransferase family protein [Aliikangiella coralliicola]
MNSSLKPISELRSETSKHSQQSPTLNLACAIIAAGNSSRLGQAKQLVVQNGQSLLNKAAMLATAISRNVSCVLGFRAEVFCKEIETLNVKPILNQNWQQGMGSSIATCVNSLSDDTNGVMILLCDQWALTPVDLQALTTQWQKTPDKIVAANYYDHKHKKMVMGAPAIFPRSFFSELTELRETGARKLLMRHESDVEKVKIDNAAFDLDIPADFKHFNLVNKKLNTAKNQLSNQNKSLQKKHYQNKPSKNNQWVIEGST